MLTSTTNLDPVPTSPSIHRDPSFSGWCDNNNRTNTDRSIQSSAVKDRDEEDEREGDEESGLELPLDRDRRRRLLMEMGSSDGGEERRRDQGEYAVFEVQSGGKSEQRLGGFEEDVVVVEEEDSKGSVSAGNVLRTICFVLVWYIFSLFLTLYNKSLLGDKLGKFPAPLLMNTFHFAMQAILSRAITWFWSDRFRSGVQISWRDYLSRDGLCLSQLCQQLLQQHWT